MKRPPIPVMVLGHTIVTVPVVLTCAALLYVCWLGGGDGVLPGIPVAAFMAMTAKAHERAKSYRLWKRKWDALVPPAERPRSRRDLHWCSALCIFLLLGWCWFTSLDHENKSAVIGLGVLAAMAMGGFFILRAVLRRVMRRGPRPSVVQVVAVIAKPVLPVPTAAAAYAALPDYCQHLLGARRS